MRNLILTGGGTAGHCTPCLALIASLEKHFDNIYYIGSENGIEKELVKKAGIAYYSVPTVKLRRSLSLQNLKIPFTLSHGVIKAKGLLKSLGASVVFSKGGYVSLPVCIAAGQMKIPLVLHESDLTLGLANKISAHYAREVLTSFKETADSLKNGLYTGAPINRKLFCTTTAKSRAHYGITGNLPVILVMGGSSGSRAINREIRAILPILTKKYTILHLCGKEGVDKALTGVKGYIQVPFEVDMKHAYAAADIAVSRAGSNCLFELLAMKIPALLIPLPTEESRGDQIQNAKYFTEKGMFKTLLQGDITPERLVKEIDSVYKNRLNITLSQQQYEQNANEKIASRIIRAAMSSKN